MKNNYMRLTQDKILDYVSNFGYLNYSISDGKDWSGQKHPQDPVFYSEWTCDHYNDSTWHNLWGIDSTAKDIVLGRIASVVENYTKPDDMISTPH